MIHRPAVSNAQLGPEVLRAKGQSGDFARLARHHFPATASTRWDFARLLADGLATAMPTFARLLAVPSPNKMGRRDALFVEAIPDDGPGHRMEFVSPEATLLQNEESNNSWRTGQGRYRGRAGAVAMAGCLVSSVITTAQSTSINP